MKVRRNFIALVATAVAFLGSFSQAQEPAKPDGKQDPKENAKTLPPINQPVPIKDAQQRPMLPQPAAAVTKPADPAKVRATYEMNGVRVPITEGEFYDTHLRLDKLEPKGAARILNPERVYEHILAVAEGKALGLEATPEEVALFDPLERNPALKAAAESRHARDGITPEMYSAYQREIRTIQKAKDLFANSMRVLSNEVFDVYGRDHYSLRMEYVEFPAARYAEELRQKPPADQELLKFWNEDKATQNQYLSQANVTVEFVSFDPQAVAPSTTPEREITREEALAYYNQNKPRLDTLLAPEQRASLYPTSRASVLDLKTPFQLLRPLIEREIRLATKIRAAFAEAKKPGADFAAIARDAGLTYERAEKVDRLTMATKYGRFGPQIFSVLNNLNAGDVSPELKIDVQIQFFYRLVAKEPAKLPDFPSVKSKLVEPYIDTTALNRARAAAQDMRTWIDQQIEAEVRPDEQRMLAEAQAAADQEITKRNVTDVKEKETISARHKAPAQAKIRQKKDALAPKHFDTYTKDHGLTVLDTGFFEATNPKRSVNADPASKVKLFVMLSPQVRSLEPGQITPVMTDAGSKTQVIAKMAERSEPDFSKMSDGDLLAIRARTEQTVQHRPIQRWQYQEISKRRELKVE